LEKKYSTCGYNEKKKKERNYARCLEKSFAILNYMLNVQEKEQNEWWEEEITNNINEMFGVGVIPKTECKELKKNCR